MSLILEALKKSERERREHLDSPPDDGALSIDQIKEHGPGTSTGRRWPVILGLIAAVGIVASSAGYRHLKPSQSDPTRVGAAESDGAAASASSRSQPDPEVSGPVQHTTPATVESNPSEPVPAANAPAEPQIDVVVLQPAADPEPNPRESEGAARAAPETSLITKMGTVAETAPEPETDAPATHEQALAPFSDPEPLAEMAQAITAAPRKPASPRRPTAAANDRLSAAALYERAVSAERRGLDGAALNDYSAAIAKRPDFLEALYGRAWIRLGQGDHAGAVSDFSSMLRVNPGMPEAYFGRGWARELAGDPARAVDDYTSAIDLAPDQAAMRFNR